MAARKRKPPSRPKGSPKVIGSGRKKGTLNKATSALKELLLGSLDDVGGQEYLVRLALKEPRAYASLLGRLIPSEVRATLTERKMLVVKNYTGIEWEKKAKVLPDTKEVMH